MNVRASALERLAASTARGLNLDATRGGRPALTSAELCGALAGVSRSAEIMIRAIALDDLSGLAECERRLVAELAVRACPWVELRPENHRILAAMVRLAIAQVVTPPKCRRCAGRGVLHQRGGLVEECERCNGSGAGSLSQSSMARECGLSRDRWSRTWSPRYGAIERHVDRLLCDGVRRLSLNLRG